MLTLLSSSIGQALANDEQSSDSKAKLEIEKIVVTSQKRIQSTQDIGVAVTSIGGDKLRDKGIDKAEDLTNSIANISSVNVTGGGLPIIVVRGVGLQNFRVNDSPTTAFYIDEVYQPNIASADLSMFDLERVEFLKGPQGGLYGRNTISGAVQVISKQPDVDDGTNGYIHAGIGTYGKTTLEGAVGTAVSDNSAVRVSLKSITSDDRQFTSTTGDFDHGEIDQWASRVIFKYDPSDDLSVLFKMHSGEDNSETPLLRAVGTFVAGPTVANVNASVFSFGLCDSVLSGQGTTPGCAFVDSAISADYNLQGDRYNSASTTPSFLENSWNGSSFQAAYNFADYTLTSITAADSMDYRRFVDLDSIPIEYAELDYVSYIDSWSQEFRLAFNGSSTYNWILGVNYAEDDIVEDSGAYGSEGLLPLAFGALGGPVSLFQDYEQKTEAFAVYGHGEWRIQPNVNLVGELRYTDATKSFSGSESLGYADGSSMFFPGIDDINLEKSFNDTSGKLAIEYNISENVMTYASVSKGFKTGGFYGGIVFSADDLTPYDSEQIMAYEVGFKSDLMERRMRLNGAAFFYDRSDVQQTATTTGENPVSRLTNIGDVNAHGAELDLTYLLSESLTLNVNLGYTDSEITDSDMVSATIPGMPEMPIEGTNTPNYSKFTGIASVNYESYITNDWLLLGALDYSYRSERDLNLVTQEAEKALLTEPGFGLANARVSLMDESEIYKVTFSVKNLLDEEYRTVLRDNGLRGMYTLYGEPMTWNLTFTYSFQ